MLDHDPEALRHMPAPAYGEALRPLLWHASRQPWELAAAAAALAECRRILAGGCPGRPVSGQREPASRDDQEDDARG